MKKIVIINRANDKIFKLVEEISLRDTADNIILINSDNLDKKSKLRNFFEKIKMQFALHFTLIIIKLC